MKGTLQGATRVDASISFGRAPCHCLGRIVLLGQDFGPVLFQPREAARARALMARLAGLARVVIDVAALRRELFSIAVEAEYRGDALCQASFELVFGEKYFALQRTADPELTRILTGFLDLGSKVQGPQPAASMTLH